MSCEFGIALTTRSESTVGMPWWFPLPDAFMQKARENLAFQQVLNNHRKGLIVLKHSLYLH